MKILLTGGAGYIGSHVSLALLENNHNVTIIDNLSTGNRNLVPSEATFVESDINNIPVISKLLQKEKFNALMHFAGSVKVEESVNFPEKYFTNNCVNSKKLIDICVDNGLKNIIFASTAAVYESFSNKLIDENTHLKPFSPYAESKIITEKYLLKMHYDKSVNYIILRYFNVAGSDPKMRSGIITKHATHLIKIASEAAIGQRDKVKIFGNDYDTIDGTPVRDYIHVSDLADIHVKSLEFLLDMKQSLIMNCGYGKGYSVKQVLDQMNKLIKNSINIEYDSRRPGDSAQLVSDISRLKEKIKWSPKYNNLHTILKTAYDWELKLKNEKIF